MFERIKKLFTKAPVPDSLEWIPMPDVDALPDDAESDAPLPPEILGALKQWPADMVRYIAPNPESVETVNAVNAVDRFRVQRIHDGKTYQSYAGASGGEARRAWEAYQASALPGLFVFMDGDDCRGSFER